MRRKIIAGLMIGLLLTGCRAVETPKLLEPVGETTDSAKVTRGEMYNITAYDSAVTCEYKEIKLANDGIIQNVNVQLGDTVTAQTSIVTLDGQTAGTENTDIDEKISRLEEDNAYLNQMEEYDIQILEYELQLIKEQGGNNLNDIHKLNSEIAEKRSALEKKKVEQQKEIAELQLSKAEGGTEGGEVVSPWDGTIVYLNTGAKGSVVKSGTVIAIVAKKDSKILFGDYIEREDVRNAHRIYARIGTKEYNVTNVPYEQFELNQRLFFKLPLYSTFYIEDAPEITAGMFASVIVISDYKEDALQIPVNAVLSDEEGYYVYRIDEGETKRQEVSVGHMTDTAVEITEGLKEGDEVYVKP